MADRTISNRSSLAGLANPGSLGAATGNPGVRIREITEFAALAVIARRGCASEVAAVLAHHVGSPIADAAKRAEGAALSVTGTAPGQWLVVERGGSRNEVERVRAELSEIAAVTDQGDGRLIIEMSGARARDALAKGIAIDLDASVFKIGDAAQTSAAHIGLQIALLDETPTFEIISARSTAESFWSWLVASAAEYGIEVV